MNDLKWKSPGHKLQLTYYDGPHTMDFNIQYFVMIHVLWASVSQFMLNASHMYFSPRDMCIFLYPSLSKNLCFPFALSFCLTADLYLSLYLSLCLFLSLSLRPYFLSESFFSFQMIKIVLINRFIRVCLFLSVCLSGFFLSLSAPSFFQSISVSLSLCL